MLRCIITAGALFIKQKATGMADYHPGGGIIAVRRYQEKTPKASEAQAIM